jgi:excisionase family DNA binding protein
MGRGRHDGDGGGWVAAADATLTVVAPALTAAVRELFVRPVRTMTGTDPKEHTMSINTTTAPASLTVSVEEAGRLLGISRGAAYRAAACGQIPTIRVGRRLLVPTARLHQLLGLTHDNGGTAAVEASVDGGEA